MERTPSAFFSSLLFFQNYNSMSFGSIGIFLIAIVVVYSIRRTVCFKRNHHHPKVKSITFAKNTQPKPLISQEEDAPKTNITTPKGLRKEEEEPVPEMTTTKHEDDCGYSSSSSSSAITTATATSSTAIPETVDFVESKFYEIIDCLSVVTTTAHSSSTRFYVDGFQQRQPKYRTKHQQQHPPPQLERPVPSPPLTSPNTALQQSPTQRPVLGFTTNKTKATVSTSSFASTPLIHNKKNGTKNRNSPPPLQPCFKLSSSSPTTLVDWSKVEGLWNEIKDTYQAEPLCRFQDDDQGLPLLVWIIMASSSSRFSQYHFIVKLLKSVLGHSPPNVLTLPNHYGMTSFHYAKYYHCPRFVLKWMTSTMIVSHNHKIQSSCTNLNAPQTHHTNIILQVLNQEDQYGKTPMDYELERKFYQILELISYLDDHQGVVVDRIPKSPHHIQWTLVEDIWYSIDSKLGGGKRYASQIQDDVQGAPLVTWLVATKSPPLQLLQSVVNAYPTALQQPDKAGMIAYHHAKFYSSPHYVTQMLLDLYPDCVNQICHQGYTPIHWEIERKFEFLLECVSNQNPLTLQREPKTHNINMKLVNQLWDDILQQTRQNAQISSKGANLLRKYKNELMTSTNLNTSTFDTSFDC